MPKSIVNVLVVFLLFATGNSFAQERKYPILNSMGRFLGVGYTRGGYHAGANGQFLIVKHRHPASDYRSRALAYPYQAGYAPVTPAVAPQSPSGMTPRQASPAPTVLLKPQLDPPPQLPNPALTPPDVPRKAPPPPTDASLDALPEPSNSGLRDGAPSPSDQLLDESEDDDDDLLLLDSSRRVLKPMRFPRPANGGTVNRYKQAARTTSVR